MAEIYSQKAPGQDLAQKGRFPMVPEGDFTCRPKGPQVAEGYFQKAPGQDLAQKSRFPMSPEGNFTCRVKGRQTVEICFPRLRELRGLCAKLPAPRDRGSPGANPTVWFQAGLCPGFCAKLPAPPDRGSPSANRRFGLKPVFVTTWRKALKE